MKLSKMGAQLRYRNKKTGRFTTKDDPNAKSFIFSKRKRKRKIRKKRIKEELRPAEPPALETQKVFRVEAVSEYKNSFTKNRIKYRVSILIKASDRYEAESKAVMKLKNAFKRLRNKPGIDIQTVPGLDDVSIGVDRLDSDEFRESDVGKITGHFSRSALHKSDRKESFVQIPGGGWRRL